MKETIDFIKKLNINDKYVVLACSYGPDSMVLLNLLQKENLNIVVAHVNHKLRVESDEEELLLSEYCLKNNLIFESMNIDKYPKGNKEMNAREKRYDYFKTLLKKYNSAYLFTAHHGDDLIETIIMRLTRGSYFKGYTGFLKITKQENYQLIRPLIYTTKEEIINYAKNNNIPYAIDYTNKEDKYTRNRIRNHILPELKKENKNVHKKFIKFSELIDEYEVFFEKETNVLYNKLYVNNKIDLNEFYILDNIFKKRLLHKILLNIYNNNIVVITDEHTKLILNLISSHKQNSYITLPRNIRVTKFYNMLEFDNYNDIAKAYNYTLNTKVDLELGTISKISKTDIIKSNDLIRLLSSEIVLPIFVRTRKIGDKIEVKNLKGSKKINDIFIDNKVPINKRDIYPVVTDANDNILWLPSLKKSKFDKQKNESYDIIIEYKKRGEDYEK
ncbi:MAG: tRNA lysidine(34) synthetase TilS [Bacilli bacterium]|nr:tRNA lysidine(34) synthetase TilS [Bacilli bacterium]